MTGIPGRPGNGSPGIHTLNMADSTTVECPMCETDKTMMYLAIVLLLLAVLTSSTGSGLLTSRLCRIDFSGFLSTTPATDRSAGDVGVTGRTGLEEAVMEVMTGGTAADDGVT